MYQLAPLRFLSAVLLKTLAIVAPCSLVSFPRRILGSQADRRGRLAARLSSSLTGVRLSVPISPHPRRPVKRGPVEGDSADPRARRPGLEPRTTSPREILPTCGPPSRPVRRPP